MTTRFFKMSISLSGISLAALLVAAAQGAIAQTDTSGLPGGPAIVVPDCLLTGSQPPNAPIDVHFVTTPDTSVNLASLRVWLRQFGSWIDVTDRLLRHPRVQISNLGIHLDGGVLPAGAHEVRVSFQDMKGRAVDATETIRVAQIGGPG